MQICFAKQPKRRREEREKGRKGAREQEREEERKKRREKVGTHFCWPCCRQIIDAACNK